MIYRKLVSLQDKQRCLLPSCPWWLYRPFVGSDVYWKPFQPFRIKFTTIVSLRHFAELESSSSFRTSRNRRIICWSNDFMFSRAWEMVFLEEKKVWFWILFLVSITYDQTRCPPVLDFPVQHFLLTRLKVPPAPWCSFFGCHFYFTSLRRCNLIFNKAREATAPLI